MASVTVKPPLWFPGRNPDAAGLWDGCVGFWPMWEAIGERIADVSGHGNHGVMTGGMDPAADWKAGLAGWSVTGFNDGVNNYISVPRNASLEPANAVSVLAYIVPTGDDATRAYVAKTNTAWSGWYGSYVLRRSTIGGGGYLFGGSAGGDWVAAEAEIADTGPTSVLIGAYNGAQYELWLNGILLDTSAKTGAISYADTPLAIGTNQVSSMPANTDIFAVGVWGRALSMGEILTLSADPSIMIRPPSLLPIYASAFSPAGAPPVDYLAFIPELLSHPRALRGGM